MNWYFLGESIEYTIHLGYPLCGCAVTQGKEADMPSIATEVECYTSVPHCVFFMRIAGNCERRCSFQTQPIILLAEFESQ